MNNTVVTVKAFQIRPSNFSCGDVVRCPKSGKQFRIADYCSGVVTLKELDIEAKNKPEFCDGAVALFDEGDFRQSGDAEPSVHTIASQILGEFDEGDPEDFCSDNYVPGLS